MPKLVRGLKEVVNSQSSRSWEVFLCVEVSTGATERNEDLLSWQMLILVADQQSGLCQGTGQHWVEKDMEVPSISVGKMLVRDVNGRKERRL